MIATVSRRRPALAARRQPTIEERAREGVILKAFAADVGMALLILVNSILSGSLTLFAEFVRGTLMMLLDLVTYVILRRVHRAQFAGYDYGTGKIEQIASAMIAVSLVLAGLWIFHGAVGNLFTYVVHSPWGLALAAVTSATNLTLNFIAWYAMRASAGSDASPVYKAQLHARFVKLLASSSIQVTMTLSALALDNVVANWLDSLGAMFVAIVTVRAGLGMLKTIMPDLLDKSVGAGLHDTVAAALQAAGAPASDILITRSRSSGGRRFVEVEVCPKSGTAQRLPQIGRLLEAELPQTRVVFCFGETGRETAPA